MANKAIYTAAAFTEGAGVEVAIGASVEVRREDTGALADLFTTRTGLVSDLINPFSVDTAGRFEFYAAGIAGGYRITVTQGGSQHVLRHQAVGTAAELDIEELDTRYAIAQHALMLAVSDEDAPLVAGQALTFRMPFNMDLIEAKASLTDSNPASDSDTNGPVRVDVRQNGVSIFQPGSQLVIDDGEKTSVTSAEPCALVSNPDLIEDAEITVWILVPGERATGLKVYLIGQPTE